MLGTPGQGRVKGTLPSPAPEAPPVALRHWFEAIDSTQARAIALARAGAEPGTRIVAARQTAGTGRGDHRWWSPAGGLYVSVVLPTPPVGREPMVPLAIGIELRRRLMEGYGVTTQLRWPNDLLTVGPSGGRKLAGVLVDQVYSIEHGPAVVAGIGVNVTPASEAAPPGLRSRIATLADDLPTAPALADVEAVAVAAADAGLRRLSNEDHCRHVVAEARRALFGRGRRAWVDGKLGGRIRDLADDGSLWLEGERGTFGVRAGTVIVEESP